MKSNNKYLQEINRNFGGVMEVNKTNNHYLREIAKNTGSVDIASHHSDNYYLKRIALNTADMITELTVYFNGKTITQQAPYVIFVGDDVVIKWGDGTTTNYTSDGYSHTYDEDGEHTITVLNVTAIGDSAFVNTDITEVFIPSHIVSLGRASFAECDLLEKVTLSEGLTSIDDGCFSMNPKLTEITIPSTVTNMGYNCFSYDPIENINLLWDSSEDIIQYGSSMWGEISTDYTFTIPTGTTSLYEAKGYPSDKLQER